MGHSASVKWLGKLPGAKKSFGWKAANSIDKGLGKALGTVPGPTPTIPAPPPPEQIDEGAYMARDRSRRRARLAGGQASTQTGASASYSAAPKSLLGS